MSNLDLDKQITRLTTVINLLDRKWERPQSGVEAAILRQLEEVTHSLAGSTGKRGRAGMSDDTTLESVHRVISLLRTLPLFNGKWFGVRQVAEKWGKAPSTTHRYLQALVKEEIVEYEEMTGKYRVKR